MGSPWDIFRQFFPLPANPQPATPRPGPQRGAETTIHAYGQVVPVVYGTGVVRGFLAYAPEVPVYGIGSVANVSGGSVSFSENLSEPEVQYAPAEYIFAQGPISAWRFIQRGTVKFVVGGGPDPNLMCARTDGNPPTQNSPELTVGDHSTVTDWSYASAKAVAHRVHFGHYAVLRTPYLIFPDGQIPDLRAGLDGRCATGTITYGGTNYAGAPPAAMLKDMAEDSLLGMGLPAGTVITNAGTDGNAASSFDRYMTARGWLLARAFESAGAGDEAFGEVLAACDSTCLWDGANLKIIPLCESAVGTYSPAAAAYAFTDDEFVLASEGEDPIEAERVPESDIATVFPVEFGPVYSPDGSTATVESAEVARSLWGTLATRRGEKLSLPCIPVESHAKAISEINSRRSVYNRTRFRWTASWRHIAVQPGDFVTLTHSIMGLSGNVALVEKVEETDDGLRFEALEWFPGISLDIVYTPQPPSGVGTNPLAPPDLGQVAKGAIPVDRLTNTSYGNLWPNPTSEISPPGGADLTTAEWKGRVAWASAYSGGYCRELTTATAGVPVTIVHTVPAIPGESYYFEAYIYTVSGPGEGHLEIVPRDKDGTYSGAASSGTHSAASWAKKSCSAVMPAGTVTVDFYLTALSASTATVVRYDGMVAKRMVEGDTGIVADSIKTSDYAEDGNGNPTAGGKLRNNTTGGVALKVSPDGIQVGTTTLDEAWFAKNTVRSIRVSISSSTVSATEGGTSLTASKQTSTNDYAHVVVSGDSLIDVTRYFRAVVSQNRGSSSSWPAHPELIPVVKYTDNISVDIGLWDAGAAAWKAFSALTGTVYLDVLYVVDENACWMVP